MWFLPCSQVVWFSSLETSRQRPTSAVLSAKQTLSLTENIDHNAVSLSDLATTPYTLRGGDRNTTVDFCFIASSVKT